MIKMVDESKIGGYWLGNKLMEKKIWVKSYSSDTFITGVSTAQWNESMNNYFKNWINQYMILSVFIKR